MNLSALGQKMEAQLSGGLYRDLDLLGNFMDNHDQDRVTKMCGHAETSRIFNSLAWTFFAQGIPILYYGTEVLMEEQRGSFWQEGWQNNTPVYKFVQRMNLVRRLQSLSSQEMKVLHTQGAADRQLVFQRGGPEGTWVFLNNNKMADAGRVEYCLDSLPKSKPGKVWVDALSGVTASFQALCYQAADSFPKVLVQLSACNTTRIEPQQSFFHDLSCRNSLQAGCRGDGLHDECRLCGSNSVPCPGQSLKDAARSATRRNSNSFSLQSLSIVLFIVLRIP